MNEGVVELTNQVVVAILVGCGGLAVAVLLGLGAWLQRAAAVRDDADEPRPHPLTMVFTRRARSDEDDDGSGAR